MLDISWLHLTVLVLASFRLTHLIVFDEITSFLRAPFLSVTYEPDDTGQIVRKIDIKGRGWRYKVGLILSCHWCVGVWSSLFTVALYALLPASFPLLVVLAVAGAAAVIESRLYPT
ncbi:DUF1360 domain-containing protein [Numidum massiliense]|uniref:DUF1360 domain-containing protein n=1 Tax=Numidum massiliense TaxID=1522315 RepID=UPI0006D569EF|nr:DUF1360 domain-containing protein [Numidum massiliense]